MSKNTDGRKPVTPEMRQTLRDWQNKTGFGLKSLFRYAEIHNLIIPSKSLSAAAFQGILMGKTRTMFPEDYAQILAVYEGLPPDVWHQQNALSRRRERIPVTDAFKSRLRAFLNVHSISRTRLLKYNGAPADLTAVKIGRILNEDTATILKSHAEFLEELISVYEAQKINSV